MLFYLKTQAGTSNRRLLNHIIEKEAAIQAAPLTANAPLRSSAKFIYATIKSKGAVITKIGLVTILEKNEWYTPIF